MVDGHGQRRDPGTIARIDLRPMLEEKGDGIYRVRPDSRIEQRCLTTRILSLYVGPTFKKNTRSLETTTPSSQREGRRHLSVTRVDLCSLFKQERHEVDQIVLRGDVKRRSDGPSSSRSAPALISSLAAASSCWRTAR